MAATSTPEKVEFIPLPQILCLVRGVCDSILNCVYGSTTEKVVFPFDDIACLLREASEGIYHCLFGSGSTTPVPSAKQEEFNLSPSTLVCIVCAIAKAIADCFFGKEKVKCKCGSSSKDPQTLPEDKAKSEVDKYVEDKISALAKRPYGMDGIQTLLAEIAGGVIGICNKYKTN